MRNTNRFFGLALCAAAVVLSSAYNAGAATYYVRKTGNNTNSGTSKLSAFLTIAKAATAVNAGDTVYVGAGTYAESVSLSANGTAVNPIRFIADTSGAQTGDAGPVIMNKSKSFNVDSDDYNQIIGFTFQGDTNTVVFKSSLGGVIKNCEFKNGKTPILIDGARVTIDNCDIHHNNDHGIEVKNGSSIVTIQNCSLYNMSKQGLLLDGGSQFVIEDTFITDCGEHGIRLSAGSNTTTLRRCALQRNGKDGFHSHGQHTLALENCLITNNSINGIFMHANDPAVTINHCTIAYNTGLGIDGSNGNGTIYNSIVAFNGSHGIKGKGSYSGNYNLVFGNGGSNYDSYTAGAQDIQLDPLFKSVMNFHLQDTSPAISQAAVSATTDDFDRNLRPSGAGPEIGCFEIAGPFVYYVRTSGADTNNGLAANTAFRTIAHAASEARRGDTVYVGSGTYTNEISVLTDGTANEKIRFVADTTGAQTNDPGSVIVSALADGAILWNTSNADYISIEGFQFNAGGRSSVTACAISNSKAVWINNCTFTGLEVAAAGVGSALMIEGCSLQNNVHSLNTTDCAVSLKTSTFNGNSSGPSSSQDVLFVAANCTFTNNGLGVSVTRPEDTPYYEPADVTYYAAATSAAGVALGSVQAKFANCTIQGNTTGVKLGAYASLGDVQFVNTTNQNNVGYGLQLQECALTFTNANWQQWPLGANGAGLHSVESILVLQNISLTNFIDGCGLLAEGGEVSLSSCTLNNNAHGAQSLNSDFSATNTTFSNNLGFGLTAEEGMVKVFTSTLSGNDTGLHVTNSSECAMTTCTLNGNQESGAEVHSAFTSFLQCTLNQNAVGLTLVGRVTGDVTLNETHLENNTDYGVYATGSTLAFDVAQQPHWLVSGNGANFGGSNTNYTFDTFTIAGGTTYGLVLTSGTGILTNAVLNANATGVFVDANSSLVATGTQFTSNTEHGLAVLGPFDLTNCTFNGNKIGMHLEGVAASDITVAGIALTNNTESGLRFEGCNLSLGAAVGGAFTMSGNLFGVWLENCAIELDGWNISNNQSGLYALNNPAVLVSNSTISGNSVWGAMLSFNGDPGQTVTLAGATIHSNGGGLTMVGAVDGNVLLQSGTVIRDNTNAGIQLVNCNLTMNDQANGVNWRELRNGIGMVCQSSTLALAGIKLEESTVLALHCVASTVSLDGCELSGVSGINADPTNLSLIVSRSRLTATGSGYGLAGHGGEIEVVNSIMDGFGMGIHGNNASPSQSLSLTNVTLGNLTGYGVYLSQGEATVVNTIFAGNSGTTGLHVESGTLSHSYNVVYGFATPFHGTTASSTELLNDPRFVDAANGNLRLRAGSPAINAGMDLGVALTTDLEGNARPSHKAFEIGAYEYNSAAGSFRVLDWREKK